MEPPKCKICGHAHWGNAPHVGMGKVDVAAEVARVANMTPDQVAAAHKAGKAKVRAAKKSTAAPSNARHHVAAGTQVPPVDTQKRGPGRPKLHADRKAYKAEKERERRARLKAKP
jgi:hypothetical protein